MRRFFADTYYYLALVNPEDQAHKQAVALAERLGARTITTDWVLTEQAGFAILFE
jgi:predicted nucleic acid-binding protein